MLSLPSYRYLIILHTGCPHLENSSSLAPSRVRDGLPSGLRLLLNSFSVTYVMSNSDKSNFHLALLPVNADFSNKYWSGSIRTRGRTGLDHCGLWLQGNTPSLNERGTLQEMSSIRTPFYWLFNPYAGFRMVIPCKGWPGNNHHLTVVDET